MDGHGEAPQANVVASVTVIALERSDSRTETLHEMLLRYPEARAQAKGEGGRGGQFSSAILVFDPLTWTAEFRELDRCLQMLRSQAQARGPMVARNVTAGQAWWNLSHRYLLCQLVRKEIHTHKTRAGHRVPRKLPANMEVVSRPTLMHGEKASMLVRVWDRKVDPDKVRAALEWIGREFRGTPSLPREMVA